MLVTVLFATHNGMRTLPRMLNALKQLTPPKDGWQLIIVDNNSSDDSVEFIKAQAGDLPLTLLSETKPGKNAALNTGIEQAEGELLVITDDDVLPQPDWLLNYEALANSAAEADIFTGAIEADWPKPPEQWILDWVNLECCFALTSPTRVAGPIEAHFVFGPNMAVRKKLFDAGERFNAAIGPTGKSYVQGSEVEFTTRMEKQGFLSYFGEGLTVKHMVRENQMERSWIIGRARRAGRGQAAMRFRPNGNVASVRGYPRHMLIKLAKLSALRAKAHLRGTAKEQFDMDWAWDLQVGWLEQSKKMLAGG